MELFLCPDPLKNKSVWAREQDGIKFGSLALTRFLSNWLLSLETSSGCQFKNREIQFLPTVDSSSHSFPLSDATASLTCAILGGNPHSSSFTIHRTIAFSSAGVHSCREIFALDRDCPPFRHRCRVVYPTPKASAVFRIEEYCPFSYTNIARRIVLGFRGSPALLKPSHYAVFLLVCYYSH